MKTSTLKMLVLGGILLPTAALAQVWTAPTAVAPGANTSAPINVSSTHQVKSGGISVGSISVTGGGAFGSLSVTGAGSFGGQVLANSADSASLPGFSWSDDTNTGIWKPAANTLAIVTAGANRIYITGGDVGIGKTDPSYKLDVAGSANATQLCIGGDCKSSWAAVTGGGSSPIVVANRNITTSTTVSANTCKYGIEVHYNVRFDPSPNYNTTSETRLLINGSMVQKIGGVGTSYTQGYFGSTYIHTQIGVQNVISFTYVGDYDLNGKYSVVCIN